MMTDLNEDDELLAALGVDVPQRKVADRSPREERIIAGFEDIERFFEAHGRAPQHGESRDIFERLYAVRLDRLRDQTECRELLAPFDKHGLLDVDLTDPLEPLDDEALLAELGVSEPSEGDITQLRHVKSREEVRAAEEIASRKPCADFPKFKPLFDQVREDLAAGIRKTIPVTETSEVKMEEIRQGTFFIIGGLIAYIAEVGEEMRTEYERRDSRLRVIYDNGTESDLLLRSLQRALHRDEGGRRISDPAAGPLFGASLEADDLETGTIYVLRSLSNHPFIAEHREAIHKIGVTGGKVETRIANAALDATYLLANVEVVATYKLANVNRTKLENLFHRLFAPAQIDLTISDRFGNPVRPREWFAVPLPVIDEAVRRLIDGTIVEYRYNATAAKLEKAL